MNTSNSTTALAAIFLSLAMAGCNKPAPAVEATAGDATARIESAPSVDTPAPAAASAPEVAAAASIGASAIEARAGDVSVKLTN